MSVCVCLNNHLQTKWSLTWSSLCLEQTWSWRSSFRRRHQHLHFWLFCLFRMLKQQSAVIRWKKWREFFLKVDNLFCLQLLWDNIVNTEISSCSCAFSLHSYYSASSRQALHSECLSVCLSVCMLAYLRNYIISRLYQIVNDLALDVQFASADSCSVVLVVA